MNYNTKQLITTVLVLLLVQGCFNDCSKSAIDKIGGPNENVPEKRGEKPHPSCKRFFENNDIGDACCPVRNFGRVVSQMNRERVKQNKASRKKIGGAKEIVTKFTETATKIMNDDATLKQKLEANSDFGSTEWTALKTYVTGLKKFVDDEKCSFSDADSKEDSNPFKTCKKTLMEYFVGVQCLRCSSKASDFITSDGKYLFKDTVCKRLVNDCAQMGFYNLCVGSIVRTMKRIMKLNQGDGDVPDDKLPPTLAQLEEFDSCATDASTCTGDATKLQNVCTFFNTVKPKKDLAGPPSDIDEVKTKSSGFSPGSKRILESHIFETRILESTEGEPEVDNQNGADDCFGDANEDGSIGDNASVQAISLTAILVIFALLLSN